ncbi:MAG: hypothetical protein WAJ85_02270 [Candidatus Baltobacteraceae bacterium]
MRNRLALVVVAALVGGTQFAPAGAASSGLAYDSVSKFSPGGDASSFQPGSFQSDFQKASQPVSSEGQGGAFGGLAAMAGGQMAGMQSMMRMMQSGTAERHYVAGSKERTDEVAAQTARIVDCAARTLTTLDLAKRTYRVTSLDAPQQPTHGYAPGPVPTDDGSKVSVTLTNKSLGSRTIEGLPTNGYNSNVQMTVSKPGGESHTMDMNMLAYYSAYAQPTPSCPRPTYTSFGSAGMPMMSGYNFLERALRASNGDSRFSVNASGPSLPGGRLSLFDVVAMGGGGGRGGMVIVSERGDVHPVSDNDPIFSVPPGFTRLP